MRSELENIISTRKSKELQKGRMEQLSTSRSSTDTKSQSPQ